MKTSYFGRGTLEELSNNIREEITKISEAELQYMNQNVFSRYNAYLLASGEHFQRVL
jgi:hypothetical protein